MAPDRPEARVLTCLAVLVVTFLAPGPAWGHAAVGSSEPQPGARIPGAPESVSVSYTEPPTQDSRFEVFDGCGHEVSQDVEILNETIEAQIAAAQPGKWSVEWAVVSAVDGHATSDAISFRVAGEMDCSAGPVAQEGQNGGADAGGSLIPIALASVVIVAIAVAIRIATR